MLCPHRLRPTRDLHDQVGDFQPDGTGRVENVGRRKPQSGMPHRRIYQVNESSAIDVRQARMRCEPDRKAGTKLQIQSFQPKRPANRVAGLAAQQSVESDLRPRRPLGGG